MFISQDFKWKTIFNQRRSAAWGPEGFLRQVSWKMINNLNWTEWWSNWPIASKSEEKTEKTERRLRRATMVAHFVSPLVATTFAVVYWVVGMYNVMHPGTTAQWMEIGYVRKWSLLSIFHISISRLFHVSLFICLLRRCAAVLYLYKDCITFLDSLDRTSHPVQRATNVKAAKNGNGEISEMFSWKHKPWNGEQRFIKGIFGL